MSMGVTCSSSPCISSYVLLDEVIWLKFSPIVFNLAHTSLFLREGLFLYATTGGSGKILTIPVFLMTNIISGLWYGC